MILILRQRRARSTRIPTTRSSTITAIRTEIQRIKIRPQPSHPRLQILQPPSPLLIALPITLRAPPLSLLPHFGKHTSHLGHILARLVER